MSSSELQMNIRIMMYTLFGGLASYGITTPDSIQTIVISAVGFAATYAWTRWGMRLNGLLEYAKSKAGVEKVEVQVDPVVVKPADVNQNTSPGISAKPA
jgi:hypothetical protein